MVRRGNISELLIKSRATTRTQSPLSRERASSCLPRGLPGNIWRTNTRRLAVRPMRSEQPHTPRSFRRQRRRPKTGRTLPRPAQSSGETDQFVGNLPYSFLNLFVDELITVKRLPRRIDKPRNDHGAKVQHQTIRVGHYRHVAAHAAGRAKKANDLILPSAASKLDHILGRGA